MKAANFYDFSKIIFFPNFSWSHNLHYFFQFSLTCRNPDNFGAKGSSFTKLYHVMYRWVEVLTQVQFMGASLLKILEGKKRP